MLSRKKYSLQWLEKDKINISRVGMNIGVIEISVGKSVDILHQSILHCKID